MNDFSTNRRRAALICFGLLMAVTAAYVAVTSSTVRFLWYWGEAESVAADVKELTNRATIVTEASANALLQTLEFADLNSRKTDIELREGELMWFRANEMYNVGLLDNGGIRYMADGKRASE